MPAAQTKLTTRKPARRPARKKPPAAPNPSDIAARAYELFVQRGGEHGSDWADWLRAERELAQPQR